MRSLLSPLPTLFPRPTSRHLSHQDVRSRRSSLRVAPKIRNHSPYSSVAEACQVPSCPPRSDWLVKDSLRLPLPRPLSVQGIVASLSRLGRSLAVELASVATTATPDVIAVSESHLSKRRNELFGIYLLVRCLLRSPLCLLTQALSSRPELVQRSATITAPLPRLQKYRAVCVHYVR